MKKLYQKDPLIFSIIWIVIYVVSLSFADAFSSEFGVQKIVTAPLCILLSLFLFIWIHQMNLQREYGLVPSNIPAKDCLYYIPLILIVSTNLWSGLRINYSILESILFVISMICVGFLEEIIFRGFLFKALCKDSLNQAILISSITFGIGHIVNLLNGAELIPTLFQIGYAFSAGYLFTILFLKTGSLIPCILTHSAINSLSCFAAERSLWIQYAAPVFLMIVPLVYALYLQQKRH